MTLQLCNFAAACASSVRRSSIQHTVQHLPCFSPNRSPNSKQQRESNSRSISSCLLPAACNEKGKVFGFLTNYGKPENRFKLAYLLASSLTIPLQAASDISLLKVT